MKNIKNINEFRVDKLNTINNNNRTLFESIMVPEVEMALKDWIENNNSDCVLIGGLALSFYVKPRTTTDVDVLFLTYSDIPTTVNKFKNRKLAFQHNLTHVEIETVTPNSINVPINVVKSVFETAIENNNIKVASPSGLIALKLFRFSRQDQADIENLIINTTIDLKPFNLPINLLRKYNKLKNSIKKEN